MRYAPIIKDASAGIAVDWTRVGIVGVHPGRRDRGQRDRQPAHFPAVLDHFPVIGAAVWVAILLCAPLRRPEWGLLPEAFKGSIFLLSLVTCASMMPVEKLPAASWQTAFGLGFVSAVFDNIPLTALALKQGGYDWGMLAYAVGFGGSMIWFGSSAGVAISNAYPRGAARSAAGSPHGWHVALAYVVGFLVMLAHHGLASRPTSAASPLAASCTAEYTVGADCSRIAG